MRRFLLSLLLLWSGPSWAAGVDYVIHISVDGLRSDAVTTLGPGLAPSLYRFRTEGAFTDEARCDPTQYSTMMNHATQMTGRWTDGPDGHAWIDNNDPGAPVTIHSNKGAYVASAFDVAHDHGLKTALYAGKLKFELFDRSWDGTHGAPDAVPPDDGQDKIDFYISSLNMGFIRNQFVANMPVERHNYVLLHLREPDVQGHATTWDVTPGSDYLSLLQAVDVIVGDVFDVVETDPVLNGRTAIVLTADHGGDTGQTFHVMGLDSGRIPFYVWGPGVAAGADLYALNPTSRQHPGATLPPSSDPVQPIRNGDAANLALDLLGLPAIPGSTLNAAHDLEVLGGPAPVLPRSAALALFVLCAGALVLATVRSRP